ncbi:MAG: hypothetical protein INQ03_04205 [Candidatus Heimdallarchaeota archaeon]|nr:hypothetical protein [Candidatus Heimdallarchaeota archaeon]
MGFPYPFPLGLPKGSVRATITLALALDLTYLAIKNSDLATNVATMAIVSLTFYFGGKFRNTAPVPRSTDRGLRAWGLPAGSIRTILTIIFLGTAGYIFFIQGTLPDYLLEIINIILGFGAGKIFLAIRKKYFGKEDDKTGIVDHLKALLMLGITGFSIYLTIADPLNALTTTIVFVSSVALGFYFGARN